MPDLRDTLRAELDDLRARGLFRRTRRLEPIDGRTALLDGRQVLVFGSNDYLGLARHPAVVEAAAKAAREWGAGATGSRLTSGTLSLHEELEAELARLKGAEAALLFSSGYLAATGTIPALVSRGDLVVADALNHACLIDGCRLSRAEVRVYRHGDVRHARELLAERASFRRALLVTDGVFSMDGDLAPLPELAALCEATDTWLMVDDAHGAGVLGATGAGTVERLGLAGRAPVQMGTLGKALGSSGAFIAGGRELIDLLRNRARSFVFSTAPNPAAAGAALAALRVMQAEPERRTRVNEHASRLRKVLQCCGLQVPAGETPIVPVIAGEADAALALSAALEEAGIWAPAIRPPTVPPGTARLRLTVTASLTGADVERLCAALKREGFPPPGSRP